MLYWIRHTGVLIVSVVDSSGGPSFEFVLQADERPLDVFHHPYARPPDYARQLAINHARVPFAD
jgi:hypothetical protein